MPRKRDRRDTRGPGAAESLELAVFGRCIVWVEGLKAQSPDWQPTRYCKNWPFPEPIQQEPGRGKWILYNSEAGRCDQRAVVLGYDGHICNNSSTASSTWSRLSGRYWLCSNSNIQSSLCDVLSSFWLLSSVSSQAFGEVASNCAFLAPLLSGTVISFSALSKCV